MEMRRLLPLCADGAAQAAAASVKAGKKRKNNLIKWYAELFIKRHFPKWLILWN